MRSFLLILLALLVPSTGVAEPRFTVSPSAEGIAVDEDFQITVQVSDSRLSGVTVPVFEPSNDFTTLAAGTTQSMTIVNGDPVMSVSFLFRVVPRNGLTPGKYPLPRAVMLLGGKRYPIDTGSIEVGARKPVAANPKSSVSFVQLVDNDEPYEGEQLLYRCEIVANTEITGAVLGETTLNGFFRESFGDKKQIIRRIANSSAHVYSIREALYANQPGALEIPARTLEAKVRSSTAAPRRQWGDFFDDLWSDVFDDFSFVQRRFTADAVPLKVKPLPPKPPDAAGYIPVGSTAVRVKLDKTNLRSGESALLSVLVESEGSLRPLEIDLERMLPSQLKGYPEKPQFETQLINDRVVQRKMFVVSIVPEYGGSFNLGPFRVHYFDPKAGAYSLASTEPIRLTVEGDAAPKVAPPDKAPVPEVRRETEGRTLRLATGDILEHQFELSRSTFVACLILILAGALFLSWRSTAPAPAVRSETDPASELRAICREVERTNKLEEELLRRARTALERIRVRGDDRAPVQKAARDIDGALFSDSPADVSMIAEDLRAVLKELS